MCARLVIPMHFFGGESLGVFVAGTRESFEIEIAHSNTLEVSLKPCRASRR